MSSAANRNSHVDNENQVISTGPDIMQDEVEIVTSNDNNVTVLPPITKVGYRLALYILSIISVCIICLLILVSVKSFDASDKINISPTGVSDSTFSQQQEIIRALQEEKKSYRDFIIQLSQTILLNLLLPILTAVLGYIFGSREGLSTRRNDGA